ncbi:MAG: Mrp/NBP35 family ATP-binding protein [Bauldia sp.]|nr:Mrp/NBP35 family ATP-binding protein [Bauldia sp.]
MAEPSKAAILDRLRSIRSLDGTGDIVSLGLVSDIVLSNGRAMFAITADPAKAAAMEPVRAAAEAAVKAMPGISGVAVVLTAEAQPVRRPAPTARTPAPARPAPQPARPAATGKAAVPGIGAIIAVASGKGGVGKSTTAVNFALALHANGLSVGLLDADVYGPSVPRLLGLTGRPELVSGRTMKPMEAHGLKAMSMGFLVDEGTPMIWRGPMVISALTQMLREVAWGELDVLVVDMPPGTGDAQLTMAQQVPLAGAVIVSTPQDLALIDARKGLAMFQRVDVPVLGIVENMSTFICPHCGTETQLFGHGGARHEAETLGVPFLGEVPLHIAIRETSDAGTPVMATDPNGPHAAAYRTIAQRAWAEVRRLRAEGRRAPPRIVIDP